MAICAIDKVLEVLRPLRTWFDDGEYNFELLLGTESIASMVGVMPAGPPRDSTAASRAIGLKIRGVWVLGVFGNRGACSLRSKAVIASAVAPITYNLLAPCSA